MPGAPAGPDRTVSGSEPRPFRLLIRCTVIGWQDFFALCAGIIIAERRPDVNHVPAERGTEQHEAVNTLRFLIYLCSIDYTVHFRAFQSA